MTIKLLTEHDLEFLSLKRDCTGSSESTLVKMPHCWKSHVTTHVKSLLHQRHFTVVEVSIHGTRGHATIAGNKIADRLANDAAHQA